MAQTEEYHLNQIATLNNNISLLTIQITEKREIVEKIEAQLARHKVGIGSRVEGWRDKASHAAKMHKITISELRRTRVMAEKEVILHKAALKTIRSHRANSEAQQIKTQVFAWLKKEYPQLHLEACKIAHAIQNDMRRGMIQDTAGRA